MKVLCLQDNLAKGLSVVSRAVATRSALPVLENILLATDGGRLKLSATNLEIALTCWIGAAVEEEGAITVPARTFVDLVNALPAEEVTLSLNERTNTLHVKCGRFGNNVRGIAAGDFPASIPNDNAANIHVPPDVLRSLIEWGAFAAATDESRPILTGALVKFEKHDATGGTQVTAASSDGFRISACKAMLPDNGIATSAIIPARALAELSRAIRMGGVQFSAQENPVNITIAPNHAVFHLDNISMVAQVIDGNFPDYKGVTPKSWTTRVVINTPDFIKACKVASVFAHESSNVVRLNIAPGNDALPGSVTVAAASSQTGDNTGRLDATVEGEPLEICFNVKFLLDVLSVAGTPQIALELTTPDKPSALRPMGRAEFVHVLSPMQVAK